MGIPAADRCEAEGEEDTKRMFEIISKYSSNPIADHIKLIDRIIYNCLIGNTDAHIKNFSLLYSQDMKDIRLAPAYDIISTVVYGSSTDELSFNIGDIRNIRDINRLAFAKMAVTVGIGERVMMAEYDKLCNSFEQSLQDAAYELKEQGYIEMPKLVSRIMINGCLSKMLG